MTTQATSPHSPSVPTLVSDDALASRVSIANGADGADGTHEATFNDPPDSSSANLTSSTPQDDQPTSSSRRIILLCTVMLCMFIVSLDKTIIGVAIPAITDEFHSIENIGWLGSAYMMTNAALQLSFGRMYKFTSLKWTLLSSILLFEIGSAVCGAAPSMAVLILGRAIAGAGAAGIFSGAIQVIIALVPLEKRPGWMAVSGAIFGFSSAVGPLVGGAFTTKVSWRWCFYLNLPIGGFVLLIVVLLLPSKDVHKKKTQTTTPVGIWAKVRNLDPIGIVLLLPCVICLVLVLQWGGSTYAWSSGRVIALLVVFAVTACIFIAWQVYSGDAALLPPKVFTQRSVQGGVFYTFLATGSMVVMVYYLPIWFQVTKQSSAITSSYQTLPFILSLVAVSLPSGIIARKTGHFVPQMLLAPIFSSTGTGLITTFQPHTPHQAWIGYQVLYGIGIGLSTQGPSLAIQASLPQSDVPIGIAANFFAKEMGGAIFVSVAQNLFANELGRRLQGISGLNAQAITTSGATELQDKAGDQIDTVVAAYNYALRDVWILALALVAATIVPFVRVEWKNLQKEAEKRKKIQTGGEK